MNKETLETMQELQKKQVAELKEKIKTRSYEGLIRMMKECPLFDKKEDAYYCFTEEEQKEYKKLLIELVSKMLDLLLLKQELNYKHLLKYESED